MCLFQIEFIGVLTQARPTFVGVAFYSTVAFGDVAADQP